jgi:hypothetical protein
VAPSGLPPQRLQGVHDGLLQEARAATATGDFWLVREVLAWEKENDFSCIQSIRWATFTVQIDSTCPAGDFP